MNSFGRIFRVHIFGESHGDCVGITIDGCPAGLPLSAEDFFTDIISDEIYNQLSKYIGQFKHNAFDEEKEFRSL